MKKVKIGLLLATLCAASVFAQGGTALSAPATDSTATIPATVTDPAGSDSTVVTDSTLTAEVPAEPPAVVEQIPPEPEPVKVAEPPPAVIIPPPVVAVKEPMDIKFHFGARFGVGISHLYGPHKGLGIPGSGYAINLKPALSFGAGLAFAFEMSSLFTLAPELQYTWYRANGEQKSVGGKAIPYVDEAGASLHSLELPILARFSFGPDLYAEVGPQIGYNFYASIYKKYNGQYKNGEERKLEANSFAFGPSIGIGANIGGILIGLRSHLGVLEYADNTNGYPWTLQISATKFFF